MCRVSQATFPKFTQSLSTYYRENSQIPRRLSNALCTAWLMSWFQEDSLMSRALHSSCSTELEPSGNEGLREYAHIFQSKLKGAQLRLMLRGLF